MYMFHIIKNEHHTESEPKSDHSLKINGRIYKIIYLINVNPLKTIQRCNYHSYYLHELLTKLLCYDAICTTKF